MGFQKRLLVVALCAALALSAVARERTAEAERLGRAPNLSSPTEARLAESAARISQAMGLRTPPRLVIVQSGTETGPAWSVDTPFGSVVGVSESLAGAVPYDVLEAVVAHEIAHVARGDAMLSRFVPRFLPPSLWRDLWLEREYGADARAAEVVGREPVLKALDLFRLLLDDGRTADPEEERWDPHPTFSERIGRLQKK